LAKNAPRRFHAIEIGAEITDEMIVISGSGAGAWVSRLTQLLRCQRVAG